MLQCCPLALLWTSTVITGSVSAAPGCATEITTARTIRTSRTAVSIVLFLVVVFFFTWTEKTGEVYLYVTAVVSLAALELNMWQTQRGKRSGFSCKLHLTWGKFTFDPWLYAVPLSALGCRCLSNVRVVLLSLCVCVHVCRRRITQLHVYMLLNLASWKLPLNVLLIFWPFSQKIVEADRYGFYLPLCMCVWVGG